MPPRPPRGTGLLRKGTVHPTRARPGSGQRLVAMLVVLLLGFTGIFARLVLLQVKDASALQALARDQRLRDVPLPAARGSILDRNGDELAMSLPAKGVFADPQLVKNPQAEALNRLLQELAWDAVTNHSLSGVKAVKP